MNNKVLGLNIKYKMISLISCIIAAIALFLPYLSVGDDKFGGYQLALKMIQEGKVTKISYFLIAVCVLSIVSILLGIWNAVNPKKSRCYIWVVVAAVITASLTILMFATKSYMDNSGFITGKFLVKNFGLGYWLALIASYVNLYSVMKFTKVSPGYIVLVIMSIIWIFPIFWIILSSLRAEQGYYVGYFMPKGFTFQNYIDLFTHSDIFPFGKWWLNTFIVAICTCVISTLMVLATAYVLSRTRFSGRKNLMKFMMIIGMFPGFMSMIAVYNILKGLGLTQTLGALVVVSTAGAAMGYYICKGFFDTIPKSVDEAAIIDGATRWQIFTKITIPLSKPIIIYTVLTSFIGPWSDYIFPSMLLGDKQSSYTVALGLKWLTDFRRIDTYYTQFAAGAIVVAIPIVILFISLQRFYVEGLSGSVKG